MTYPHGPNQSLDFNPNAVPQEDREDRFDPIPPGWYSVTVVDSEVKPTAAGGQGVNLQLRVNGPTHAGRTLFYWINIRNANAKAEAIGRGEIFRLTEAMNGGRAFGFTSTAQLHGRPFLARVTVQKDPEYGDSNKVRGVKPIQAPAAPQGYAPPPAGPPQGYQAPQPAAPAPPQQGYPQPGPPPPTVPYPPTAPRYPQQEAPAPAGAPPQFAPNDLPF